MIGPIYFSKFDLDPKYRNKGNVCTDKIEALLGPNGEIESYKAIMKLVF